MENIEILIQRIDQDIKQRLSEKRYKHSIGVMKKIEILAKKYNVDVEKAKLIGLAHDIAKEMTKEDKLIYVQDNNIKIDEIEQQNIDLLHAKIGADLCKKKYNFSQDMQDAIKYHTIGNINMDNLAKILFISDKTEDGRTYIDLNKVKELEEKGIDDVLIYVLNTSIKFTIDKNQLLHPDSIYTRNKFLKEKIINNK